MGCSQTKLEKVLLLQKKQWKCLDTSFGLQISERITENLTLLPTLRFLRQRKNFALSQCFVRFIDGLKEDLQK